MTRPRLQNSYPEPNSTGHPQNISLYVEIVDDENDLDVSTVVIYLDGEITWVSDAPQTPAYSGYKTAVSLGYGYRIASSTLLSLGIHTLRYVAQDSVGNELDQSYVFYVAVEAVSARSILEDATLVTFDFPLQFEDNGNAKLTVDEKALNDNIKLAVFIKPLGVPLYPLGVGVQDYAFDPNDEILQAELAVHITDGLSESVDGIKVNPDFAFDEQEDTLNVAVPYVNTKTRKSFQTVISIPRHKVN